MRTRGRRWLVVLSLALLAVVVAVMVRRDPAEMQAVSSAGPPDANGLARGVRPRVAPRVARVPRTLPMPVVAESVVPAACATGTAGREDFWSCLPRTEPWDRERARFLIDRLAKHSDIHIAPEQIECKTRCCRILLSKEEYTEYRRVLDSSVGLRIGPTDGYIGDRARPSRPGADFAITTCWRPDPIDDYPDRAVERDELMAAITDDLAACARGLAEPATVELTLQLAVDGTIDSIERGEGVDGAHVACVEDAVRRAAMFEPADDMTRSVPLRARLQP